MEITSAEFVISNTDVKKCPGGTFPEYAFIGRSNVGKSSLINMLTGRKGLAMTSATPGKTMLINHFLINKNWYIVDLPGYGYAKRGQKGQEQIQRIIEDLHSATRADDLPLCPRRQPPRAASHRPRFHRMAGRERSTLRHRFHQSRQAERRQDKQQHPPLPGEAAEQWEELPPHFITSSENRMGRDELLGYIEQINKEINSKP